VIVFGCVVCEKVGMYVLCFDLVVWWWCCGQRLRVTSCGDGGDWTRIEIESFLIVDFGWCLKVNRILVIVVGCLTFLILCLV